jgi:STE24 endopeptidase
MNGFTYLFLVALVLSVGIRLWLDRRQIHYVYSHRDKVPSAFADQIPIEAHQKAADYTVARTRAGALSTLWDTAWLLAWTLGGGLALLAAQWERLNLGTLWTGVGVIVSATLIMGLLDLPLAAYRTFVVEQRFGFNRMSPGLWVLDVLKSASVMLVLGTPLVIVILWLMQQAGGAWWIWAWLVWMAFTFFMLWAYPTIIAPLFNRFEPLQDKELVERINDLLARCGFNSQGVYVMDGSKRSSHGNAYFTGFGRNKRIVFFDTLIEKLKPGEIEAVLAHELGHYRKHHVRKGFAISSVIGFIALALLAWLMQQTWFYHGLGVNNPSLYSALLLFLLVMPIFTFFLQPAFAMLSRRHEFEADAFASEQADATSLISALVILYRDNASTLTPDPIHSAFYDSHPPASVRVAQLEASTAH